MNAPTRVLVTGGAGFIGSSIVDQLVARSVDVVVLDNLSPAAHARRPDYLNPSTHYVWGDVRDATAWAEALDGVDAVCHQAGKVGLGVNFGDAGSYVDDNDVGWVVGLGALHHRRFVGRIVLASSMVVYGEGRYTCVTHGVVRPAPRLRAELDAGRFEPRCPTCASELGAEPIPEDAPLEPRNVYAATKLHQEHLTAAFAREHDVDACWLRYHNVYGPRMPRDTPYAGVASIFRSALENGRAPTVTEDGMQRRDFVHVADVANANVRALLGDEPVHGAVNVGSGTPRSVLEMAEALAGAMGVTPTDGRWPTVSGGYRLGDVRHVFASTDTAVHRYGLVPTVDFADGMREFATVPLRDPVVSP
ncbi:MAG: NAD-dependent epimerase/dehydratase family protein [Acidimicrobiales bacterium]|nr:NAD-dependent epimerase/dehydratase family protein [Acidimicrobiales bacterium]